MDHYAFFLSKLHQKQNTKARVGIPNVKKALERFQKHLLCSYLVSGFHYIKYPDYIFPVDKLVKIGGIVLEKDDFLRFPEFFFPKVEARWWEKQQKLYTLTRQNNTIELEFHQENNQPLVTSVALGSIPTLEIIKRLGPINLVALIFVVLATHVFYKHFSLPHQICGFFTGFLALYLVSAAPIAYRDITLPTDLFRLLIKGVLFGAGGLITLVHFALIFPKPKPFLLVRPKLIYGLYGYFLITVILYLLKISAFGSTFPFLVLWTLVMAGAFLHSWFTEDESLLKEQIRLILVAPITIGFVFILFLLLPGFLDLPPMDFSYFALFSLPLPFALCFAIENFYLYQENVENELRIQNERGKILEELHDNLGHNLTSIKSLSKAASVNFSKDPGKVEEAINHINNFSGECLQQLRNFLWVIDLEYNSWEDLIDHFKEFGGKALEVNGITLEWTYSSCNQPVSPPNFSLKFNLYRIYKEIINNILKHANAQTVKVVFGVDENKMVMNIEDDGVGFDHNEALRKKKSYGLKRILKRTEEIRGKFDFFTSSGKGSQIRLTVNFGVYIS